MQQADSRERLWDKVRPYRARVAWGALLLVPLVQIIALAVFYVATRYYNAELLKEQERP